MKVSGAYIEKWFGGWAGGGGIGVEWIIFTSFIAVQTLHYEDNNII